MVCSDQDIHVLPSKTIPQGLSACVMFNPDVELEDNLAEMNEAIENVKSGEVTYAIKDTTYDGLEIKKDEYMGIFGKDICVSCPDCMEATKKLLDKMLDDDSELVTLIYGDTTTKKNRLKKSLLISKITVMQKLKSMKEINRFIHLLLVLNSNKQ